jgi:hypothetical protein
MRFPTRLLAANLWFALVLWAGFLGFVAAVTVGVAVFGSVSQSAWELAAQLPRWYALFAGVALVREFLPLYVAHGQTRRQFGAHAALTVTVFAPFLSALLVTGYLLETGLYGLAGWPQTLGRAHLFTEATQAHLVFLEYLVEFLAWIVAGSFVGAGFYRWQAGGLLTIPVGIGLIVLAENALGREPLLPLVRSLIVDLPQSLVLTTGLGLATFLLGLLLSWAIIHDMPLRNQPA